MSKDNREEYEDKYILSKTVINTWGDVDTHPGAVLVKRNKREPNGKEWYDFYYNYGTNTQEWCLGHAVDLEWIKEYTKPYTEVTIDSGADVCEWVPVSEGNILPKDKEKVLVKLQDGTITGALYNLSATKENPFYTNNPEKFTEYDKSIFIPVGLECEDGYYSEENGIWFNPEVASWKKLIQ